MATIVVLLGDHGTLGVRSVDRVFLAGYVPELQSEGMVVRFALARLCDPIAGRARGRSAKRTLELRQRPRVPAPRDSGFRRLWRSSG
jgi:hypothetical protein